MMDSSGLWERVELRIALARQKHPRATLVAFFEETIEVAKAHSYESTERFRDELVDVIVVAVRLLTEG